MNAKQSTYNLQNLEKQSLVNQAKQQIQTFANERKSAQARLDIDKNQVDRYSKLLKDGAVSAAQIDNLRKEQQESKRGYEKTESTLNNLNCV